MSVARTFLRDDAAESALFDVSTLVLKDMARHPTLLCMCVRFPYICRNGQPGYTGAVESSRSPAFSLSSLSRYNRTDTDKSAVDTGERDTVHDAQFAFLDPQHVHTGPTAMPNSDHDARAQLQAPVPGAAPAPALKLAPAPCTPDHTRARAHDVAALGHLPLGLGLVRRGGKKTPRIRPPRSCGESSSSKDAGGALFALGGRGGEFVVDVRSLPRGGYGYAAYAYTGGDGDDSFDDESSRSRQAGRDRDGVRAAVRGAGSAESMWMRRSWSPAYSTG
ncbi:hypothetical protein K438DRAFT_1955764 [Mycena galopus ATCC 62051]|nr:hypothetical protein K438DRAFT_1955764 [Mycena galopus ATCC 62051]